MRKMFSLNRPIGYIFFSVIAGLLIVLLSAPFDKSKSTQKEVRSHADSSHKILLQKGKVPIPIADSKESEEVQIRIGKKGVIINGDSNSTLQNNGSVNGNQININNSTIDGSEIIGGHKTVFERRDSIKN